MSEPLANSLIRLIRVLSFISSSTYRTRRGLGTDSPNQSFPPATWRHMWIRTQDLRALDSPAQRTLSPKLKSDFTTQSIGGSSRDPSSIGLRAFRGVLGVNKAKALKL